MHDILLIDDDPAVRAALVDTLTAHGFAVLPLGTAVEALRTVSRQEPDIILLDLGLPDLDGASTLRMLRGLTDVPVIIVTARSDERSIVELLDAGADDYVVKPFSNEQLVARVSALLRRTRGRSDRLDADVLTVGSLRIDLLRRTTQLDGRNVELNRREFDLLAYLALRENTVVTRRDLLDDVWHGRDVSESATIDVHVSWLRRKLGESATNPRYLHTVRGVGLKLTAPE